VPQTPGLVTLTPVPCLCSSTQSPGYVKPSPLTLTLTLTFTLVLPSRWTATEECWTFQCPSRVCRLSDVGQS